MKITAFNGSPREGGNTEFLLRTLLDAAQYEGIETDLIQIGGSGLQGCTACMGCRKNQDKKCVLQGDNFNQWFEKMLESEAIVIGSPTYFAGISADAKALIDRAGFVALGNGGLFSRKIGAGVVAVRRGGAVPVLDTINHMFLMSRMIVPGSTYWNIGMGREKGEVKNDTEGMRNMQDLGQTIAWLLKQLDSGQTS